MSGKFSEIKTATTHDQAPRHCDMVPVPLGLQPKTMCIQSCFCSRWEYTDLSFLSLHPQKVWEQGLTKLRFPEGPWKVYSATAKLWAFLKGRPLEPPFSGADSCCCIADAKDATPKNVIRGV
eukprot:CAMPEP_0174346974 /NCGR_PEP_ID=MMETSP0811_2-20130205/2896_1 /TAXON_ID=73025 ORGANISM="Eutreptiella gymnastica-like, Strain CCMP1594" /NCGR_SAMPLE_ID=MMETSP0811_2 /ASSEMBLY_ACC=CAM_ASM_000667 /LENGTH=121 /DNA_ID=CAMNT_0015472087 /DNA_START=246 /DNA_END=612 /DNA_ORIENTATION=-